ncbi:hypothetical protein SB00610_05066 [Klebsiella quasipneumoniae subsp. similipneumoniae]|nr:hypothetical protein SB00610_05066 [Klebsiella quasipneumoniae subsp. similipneumoniae]
MRFERFFAEAHAFAHHIRAHQPGDRGVDVHNGAAGEIQRAMRRQQTAAPDHMRNRHVGERHPHHHENQHGGETDTFSQRPDDQPDGDAGERALEGDVDILIEGAHQRFQFNIFQHHPVKAAEEAAAGAKGQGIAINDPQYADQAKGDNHLRQHGKNVLTADQAAVKQRNPRDSHKQNQRGANHHKRVIGFVRHRRRGHRQPRKKG